MKRREQIFVALVAGLSLVALLIGALRLTGSDGSGGSDLAIGSGQNLVAGATSSTTAGALVERLAATSTTAPEVGATASGGPGVSTVDPTKGTSSTTASTAARPTAPSTSSPPPTVATPPPTPTEPPAPSTAPPSTAPASTAPPAATTPTTGPSSTASTAAPSTAPTTAAPPSGGTGTPTVMEQRVIDAVNTNRIANGCPALVVDPALQQAAHGYAAQMVRDHHFDHTSVGGESPGDRARRAGYQGGVGENIMMGFRDSPEAAVNDATYGWMNSPGHRRNIVNCGYTRTGVGYDPGNIEPGYASGSWVQMFG